MSKDNRPLISLSNVDRTYRVGTKSFDILCNISLKIYSGEMVAIVGPSGSGKSTLMNIIGLLDRPSSGVLTIDGEELSLSMPDQKLAYLRSKKIGFVFQSFNLLPRLTTLGNVLLPAGYSHASTKSARDRAQTILTDLSLSHRLLHKPPTLSGGEKQRVAIARALINNPEIILADEPTGNLDSKSGTEVLKILKSLNKKGKTILVVTHDLNIAEQCGRIISLFDGKIVSDSNYNEQIS